MPEFSFKYKRAAAKYLSSVNAKTRQRILEAISGLANLPPLGDIRSLEGRDGKYRLRVGNYRVIFSYEKDGTITIILIEDIGPRGDIYK